MTQEISTLLRTLIDRSGGVYSPSGASLSAGQASSGRFDQFGHFLVALGTTIAGEDLVNDVQKVEQRYSAVNLTATATLSILRSTTGQLGRVNIGLLSNPTVTIYDNASGASGTVLLHVDAGQAGSYVVDLTFVNGATAWVTGGNAISIPVSIR